MHLPCRPPTSELILRLAPFLLPPCSLARTKKMLLEQENDSTFEENTFGSVSITHVVEAKRRLESQQ